MSQNRIIADATLELTNTSTEALLNFQRNCLTAVEYASNSEDKATLLASYNCLQRELNSRKPEWMLERCETRM